jgi:hypothetical protein
VGKLSLTILTGAGFEGQEKSNGASQARTDNSRGSILRSLLNFRSEHPEQTNENGKPAHESYHHGPLTRPTIVHTDNPKAGDEQQ